MSAIFVMSQRGYARLVALGPSESTPRTRMDFQLAQQLSGSVDAVAAALLDPEFLAASAHLPKVGGADLLEERRDGDVVHRRIRYRFTAELSSAVKRVVDPDKLTWVDESTYDLATHRGEHRIVPDNYGDRLQASYDESLTADGPDRSRRTATGSVKVRMPLVGGRVERAIVSGLEEHAAAEADLLNRWLAGRAG
jgi:Protein of unknown function (DUF2505)